MLTWGCLVWCAHHQSSINVCVSRICIYMCVIIIIIIMRCRPIGKPFREREPILKIDLQHNNMRKWI